VGSRVLLVDLDPQANATSSLGVERQVLQASVYDALMEAAPLESVILEAVQPGLDLAPSAPGLAGAQVELVEQTSPDREQRLQQALEPLRERYPLIIVDCPPSLGLLTVNALVAADAVLIPVQCEYLALEGLGQLVETLDLVRQHQMLSSVIPRSVRLSEAPSHGLPARVYDPASRGALAYAALAEELLARGIR
jgi:chromosome partitioning protein